MAKNREDIQSISDEVWALHREAPPIDLHADTLLWTRFVGYDMLKRHAPPLPKSLLGGHVDVPRLEEGGYGAQFFGLVSLPFLDPSPRDTCLRQINMLHDAIKRSNGRMHFAKTLSDTTTSGIAAFLGIEGAHALEGNAYNMEMFAKAGVKYIGLLHFSANACGAPALGWGTDHLQGLTEFGRDIVRACEALGVIVDLTHINRRGYMDACTMAQKPMIVSHTGVSGVHNLKRNIDDEQLRAVAKTGGVIGIISCPAFLGHNTLDAYVAHIEHTIKVAGEDSVALGSDWDGFVQPVSDLDEPAKLPWVTQLMLERGHSHARIAKLLRKNVLRVLSA